MPLKSITPPTVLPLAVSVVRQHIKQDITDDDNLIAGHLGLATEAAETLLQQRLIASRWQLSLDGFPSSGLGGFQSAIQLPLTPLIQVVSITYTAMDGTLQTMPTADYVVDQSGEPARITPVFGKIWPIPLPQINSVKITFDVGYCAPISAIGNAITVTGWKTLAIGDNVRLSNSGGALPAPLQAKTDYFIQSIVSAGVYTLAAAAGGNVIALTTTGTGLNFIGQPGINRSTGELPDSIKCWLLLRCDSLYSYRGETANIRGAFATLPWIDRLLDSCRVVLM